MAGMMSGNDDFSWDDSTIFDKIGNQEKREEYLTDLSGTGNNAKEMIEQLRSLDEDEMKSILYDLPAEDREEFLNDYYGVPQIDTQNVAPSPEVAVEGPANPQPAGMMPPLDLNASVNF
tara:strand:- start:328 stop:684 length:357 start_codon:yes stop_codon:yes gene_type:complete